MAFQFGSDSGGNDKILARQAREKERTARLLDARARTMAVDKDYLKKQKKAKRAAMKAEKAADRRQAQMNQEWNQQISQMEWQAMQDAKNKQQMLNLEWKKQMMQKKKSSTWDLNDPDALRNQRPARVGEDDPRCGPSSMQKFAGESGANPEVQRQRQAEMTSYLQMQIQQKRAKEQRERDEDRAYGQQQIAIAAMVSAAEFQDMDAENRARLDNMNQNRMLAAQNRRSRLAEKAQDEALSQLEMKFQRHTSKNRGVGNDSFKGMTPEQSREIFEVQARQREEMVRRREQDKRDKMAYDQQVIRNVQLMNQYEYQQMQDEKSKLMNYKAELQLQKAQNGRAAKAAARASPATDDFGGFAARFGSSAR